MERRAFVPQGLRLAGTALLPRQIWKRLTSLGWTCWEKGRAFPDFANCLYENKRNHEKCWQLPRDPHQGSLHFPWTSIRTHGVRYSPKGQDAYALQGLASWYWALCLAVCPTWGKDKPHFSCPIKEHKVSFEHHTFTLFFFFFHSTSKAHFLLKKLTIRGRQDTGWQFKEGRVCEFYRCWQDERRDCLKRQVCRQWERLLERYIQE